MRNFNFSVKNTAYLFLFSGGFLSAQQVIIEQENTMPGNNIEYKHHFDEENYTMISEGNGEKVYVANPILNQGNPQMDEEGVNAVLSINLVFDQGQYIPSNPIRIFNESGDVYLAYWEEVNPVTVNVPPGVYDVVTDFSSGPTKYTIVKELVDVLESSTVELNVAEANNYISINTYDENGNPLEPGVYDENTDSYSLMLFDRTLVFTPANEKISYYGYVYDTPFTGDPLWNFYINDVSDRYSIIQSVISTGHEGGKNYFSKFYTITGIDESFTMQNNPENFVFHEEKIQPSPLGMSSGNLHPAFYTITTYNGNFMVAWSVYNTAAPFNPEEGVRYYINNAFDENAGDLLVFPAIVDYVDDIGENYPIVGNAIVSGENNEVFYGSGATFFSWRFLGYQYYYTENGLTVSPFHPRFSFTASENPDIIQGDNAPISVMVLTGNYLSAQYKGRYGEVRDSDFFNTNIEIKQNGTTISSGIFTDDYFIPFEGVIDIILTDNNIEVDGLTGKNIVQATVDQNQEDMTAPTLQMLQFRDNSGVVTDRFSAAADGTVRLAAGDFRLNLDDFYYEYNPGNTVEFYYSPYNQNNWAEIELTEYPEYFQMPAFGDYYEASLASVVVPQDNTWFDVKIICTDAAGNKQEQVISPAFKVEQSNMGTNEVNPSGLAVYPNPFTNEIKIKLPEYIKGNYDFKVSDITGKTIYRKNQNERSFVWNGSSLPKGVYILSIESNGKTIAKKVVKK